MDESSPENLLNAIRRLRPEQRRLLDHLLKEKGAAPLEVLYSQERAALDAVEKSLGTIKGLDR